jgi:hypothetical protein
MALLAGALIAGPAAFAFQPPPNPAAKPPAKPAAKPAAKPSTGTTSVTGPVKGAPSGKTFVIARKGGTVTVDASSAKIRDDKGKFTSMADIKGGVMVTAKGTLSGTTLKAQEITVHPRATKVSTTAKPTTAKPGPTTTKPAPKKP